MICGTGTGLVGTSPGESGSPEQGQKSRSPNPRVHESGGQFVWQTWGNSSMLAGLVAGLVNESGSPQVRRPRAGQASGRSPGWRSYLYTYVAPCTCGENVNVFNTTVNDDGEDERNKLTKENAGDEE